jgi:hypothetical protein
MTWLIAFKAWALANKLNVAITFAAGLVIGRIL